ncbi:MAG: tyrosine-type recombinase/integrase [Acidimicrobiia bacterium]|nr:tyrosine-type recombinase/integrase [Acidimicrobiia bacterium]
MKRPQTLSAPFVKTIRQPGRYGDGRGGHGLSLLVQPTNIPSRLSKTWSQRIRLNGRETNLGLGSYPAVTLAEARRRALRNRQSLEEGRNPRSGRTPTFQQAAAKVIDLHSGKWRPGSRSRRIWESSLKTHVFPHIGRKQVNLVTSKDIMKCLSPIWHQKPETARRVRQRIGAIMKWAMAEGYLESDPTSAVLAGLGKNSTRRNHMRALKHREVGSAIRTIEASNAHWATIAAFKLLTLTATRSGEVRNATWDEIDLTEDTWEIPGERTKTGRPHRVPLSRAARRIINNAAALTGATGLVFPSPTGRPLSDSTISKLVRENGIDAVPHGMRSSFRDWCRDSGVTREIAEAALAHTVGGVEGAYARSDLLKARRPIMEDWARYLET